MRPIPHDHAITQGQLSGALVGHPTHCTVSTSTRSWSSRDIFAINSAHSITSMGPDQQKRMLVDNLPHQ